MEPRSAIRNAGKATNRGIEIETRWAIGNNIDFGATLSLLDATYDLFNKGVCANSMINKPITAPVCEQTGNDLPYSPDASASVYADFTYPLFNSINLVAGLTYTYSSEYFTDGTNDYVGLQNAFSKFNARIGLFDDINNWSVSLIAKNMADETTLDVTQFALGSYLGYASPPRTITLQGTYYFGDA